MATILEELAAKGIDPSELLNKLRDTASESQIDKALELGGGSRMATPSELSSIPKVDIPNASLKVGSNLPVPTLQEAGFSMPGYNQGVIETSGKVVGEEAPSLLSKLESLGSKAKELVPPQLAEIGKGINKTLSSPLGKAASKTLSVAGKALEPLAIRDIASGELESDVEKLFGVGSHGRYSQRPNADPKTTPVPAIAGEIDPKTGKPFPSEPLEPPKNDDSKILSSESDDSLDDTGVEYTGPQTGSQQEEGAKLVEQKPEEAKDQSQLKEALKGSQTPNQLQQYQDQANKMRLFSLLSNIGEKIGTGITGVVDRGTVSKPVMGDVNEQISKMADQPVKDYLQRIEFEKHDPNSQISKAYRDLLVNKLKIDKEVVEGASAANLDKIFPILEKFHAHESALEARKLQQEQANYYKQARLNLQRQGVEDRNIRLARTQLESLKNKLASGGGSPANQVRTAIISANRMFSTAGLPEDSSVDDIKKLTPQQIERLNKLSPQYVAELTLEMNKLLAGSTAPAASTFKKLLPRNIKMDAASIESWLKSNPTGAEQAGFVKDMLITAARVKKDSNQYVKELQKKYTAGTSHIQQYLPQDYADVMSMVSEPFEKEEKKVKQPPSIINEERINVINPQRKLVSIKKSQLEQALKEGYRQ